MPSYFESLSMVALEAWALGQPVLANGRCDVLKGQCIRSNAGLYYESYEEFVEALYALESNGPLHARLGRNGREFFAAELRLAGDRAEVPRHVRAAASRAAAVHADRAAARMAGAPPRGPSAGRARCSPACRRRDGRSRGLGASRMTAPIERRRASTRCSRRSATATPSATRCSASSACCAAPATTPRSSSRPPIARLEHLTIDYRDMVGDDRARRRPDPSLLDRIARLAHRLRAARPDGARLPQHHAARVLPRRAQGAGQAVLPRPPRADRLHRALRARARRLRVQPRRSSRRSASRAPACCRSCPTSPTSTCRPTR